MKGLTVTGTGRRGKLLLLETSGPTLGVRFGMTGVLLLDGDAGVEGLFYGPHLYDAKWLRGGLEFSDGRSSLSTTRAVSRALRSTRISANSDPTRLI